MKEAASGDGDYLFRRPRRGDEAELSSFSSLIWPTAPRNKLAGRWWWNGPKEPQCLLAEHRASGEIAAMCGARRTRFAIGSRTVDAVSICDWDVSPRHKGKGLGRGLVQQAGEGCSVLYTTSISASAAAAFSKLGWTGDARVPISLANPQVTAAVARLGGPRKVQVRVVDAGQRLPLDLRMFDELWSRGRPADALGMVRDGRFLLEHLAYCPDRKYRLALSFHDDALVGYLLFRILPRRSFRRLPWVRVGLLVDMFRIPGLGAAEALIAAASEDLVRAGVGVCAMLATERGIRERLPRMGFVSANETPFGKVLAPVHTRCMFSSSEKLPQFLNGWSLSFADNDMDFVFGSATESPPVQE